MPRRTHQYEHMEPELGDTSHLSPRQRDVVDLLRKGKSNPEIAAELGITLDTAASHVDALKDRFCAINKQDLICQMWIHGILERPRMMSLVAFLLCALAALPFARNPVRPAPQGRPKVAVMYRINRQEISGVLS